MKEKFSKKILIVLLLIFIYNTLFIAFYKIGGNDWIKTFYTDKTKIIIDFFLIKNLIVKIEILTVSVLYFLNLYYKKKLRIKNSITNLLLIVSFILIYHFSQILIASVLEKTLFSRNAFFDNVLLKFVFVLNYNRNLSHYLLKFIYFFNEFVFFAVLLKNNINSILVWQFGKLLLVPKKLYKHGRLVELDHFIEKIQDYDIDDTIIKKTWKIVSKSSNHDIFAFYIILKFINLFSNYSSEPINLNDIFEQINEKINELDGKFFESVFYLFEMPEQVEENFDNLKSISYELLAESFNKKTIENYLSVYNEFLLGAVFYNIFYHYLYDNYDSVIGLLALLHKRFYNSLDEHTFLIEYYPYKYIKNILFLFSDLIEEIYDNLKNFGENYPEINLYLKTFKMLVNKINFGGIA